MRQTLFVIALLLPLVSSAVDRRTVELLAADNADASVSLLLRQIDQAPQDPMLWAALARALVARGQLTGDASRYEAALRVVEGMEAGADSDELRASALINLHRFAEAEVVLQPHTGNGDRFDLLMGDVLLETGRWVLAGRAYDRAMAARPGALVYARAALHRYLGGDVVGAIELNQRAARATHPADAALLSWILSQGSLYALAASDARAAGVLAEAAVRRSATVAARFQLARVQAASGQVDAAIGILELLASEYPSPQVLWWLHDLYDRIGQPDRAGRIRARMSTLADRIDPRGYAHWLIDKGSNLDLARRLLGEEIEQRQDARTLFLVAALERAEGRLDRARDPLERALASGLPEPELQLLAASLATSEGTAGTHRDRAARLELLMRPGLQVAWRHPNH